MIRVLESFAAKMWLALILLIILGGIFMGATRLLLPIAAEYRQEVQELVSRELGQQVKIENLKTNWRGYGPELVLSNVLLIDQETGLASLRVAEIHIGIGILDSLLNRALTLRQITFYRTQLLIKRRSDGSVVLAGLEGIEDNSGDSSDLFLLPFRISLKQSEIFWENQSIGAAPVRFTDVDFTISNGENRHQIEASMRLPGKDGGDMQLIADVSGAIQQSGAWSGEVYLSGDKLAISTILRDRMPENSAFETGTAKMELWSSWEKGRITSLEGSANFNQLKLVSNRKVSNKPLNAVEIDQLGGRFKWQRNSNGWLLDIADIEFVRNNKAWPKAALSLLSSYDRRGNIQLRSGMDFIRIDDVLDIIRMFPLPSKTIDQALHTIQPVADLNSLQLRFQETLKGPLWSGRGQLKNTSIEPWKEIPGINNLNARFWLNQEQGTIELESNDVTANLPQLFREKIKLDELRGRIHWKQTSDNDWLLESKRLVANNQDIKTITRVRLEIPGDDKQPHLMDLQTNFYDGNGSATPRYLPVTIMDEELVEWLDKSIIGGSVPNGSAIYRGSLEDFPFKKNNGHFEVLFNVKDVTLDYEKGWPRIENLDAELRFHNSSLDIFAINGAMLNSKLHNLHGRIDDLEKTSPLVIKGTATGPLSDELRILRETPLAEDFGTLANPVNAKGDANLAINLSIPIDEGDYRVNGKLNFIESTLTHKGSTVPISKINGILSFDENGIQAKGIKASILEENIKVDISQVKKTDATLIKATGAISGSKLNKHFPDHGLDQLQGRSNWSLQVNVPSIIKNKDKLSAKITASSDLVGTSINQPAPVGKNKKQKKLLRLVTEISDNSSRRLRLNYGNALSSDLFFTKTKQGSISLERGAIVLGGGNAKAPKSKQLILSGGLKELDLTPWFSGKGGQKLPKIKGENLSFGKLKFGETELKKVKINFSEKKQAISGNIKSNVLSGRVRIPLPFKSKPIIVNLDKLAIKLNPDKLSDIPKKSKATPDSTDPRSLPALTLTSKRTLINGRDFGPLNMATKRVPEGLKLERLKISSKRLNLSARGRWVAKKNRTQSSIRAKAKTDSLGKLLATLGFAPNLKKAPAEIEADLIWSGSPRQFNNTDVTGRMEMRIGKGRFLEVDPGLGRVFGLLNISALQRRLTMDFSDMFKKGFSFDKAEGTFELDHGDAYTNDLRLESPAALIEISGRTGLVSQDFDQQVTVTPTISTTLPVAAAIAGGPAAGAAVLLMQKLIGKQVDKVSTTKYSITGPWDNARINKLSQNIEQQ